jgi:hypothetical protein
LEFGTFDEISLLLVSNLPVFSMWAGLCLWNSALRLVTCNIDWLLLVFSILTVRKSGFQRKHGE